MWGWSRIRLWFLLARLVFPMYVGVIPRLRQSVPSAVRIPHVCGGDPKHLLASYVYNAYSPCMWGWSKFVPGTKRPVDVFPMYVGVILKEFPRWTLTWSIPHVCGGDPQWRLDRSDKKRYSPCMWGWSSWRQVTFWPHSVFPMYVGVIPTMNKSLTTRNGIPHVCGGDPQGLTLCQRHDAYSPCMWGWSWC